MFWKNYYNLCLRKGISPNAAAKEMKISSGSVTEWKKGREPQMATIKKIADYFGVPVNALTSDTPEVLANNIASSITLTTPINEKESRVLFAYRSHPEMQPAVDKLLGVTDDGVIVLSQAAKSSKNRKPGFTQKTSEKWSTIENAPETEDELL